VTFNIITNDVDPDGTINPATIDLDPLTPGLQTTISITGQGTFTLTGSAGDVTFIPVPNFNGQATPVTYQVCDNGVPAMCDEALISVTVVNVNDPPVAVNDNFEAKENQKFEGNILTNDYDPDGGILILNTTPIEPPAHGTLVILPNGDITYKPIIDFRGTDTFTYEICDNETPASCVTAIVTIVIGKDENCEVFVPNSFSPNGDQIHDNFKIRCLYNYDNPIIEIYNRWGNQVFKKEHYGDVDFWGSETEAWWNGGSDNKLTVGNALLPVGTYYYVLKLNSSKVLTGFLFLNR
jgi:gliding motility-associated-like protein